MSNLLKLIDLGQSYWLDNLSREIIMDGELKKRVSQQGLRGITSNPTIFNKAISGGDRYDTQLKKLLKKDLPTEEIYEGLAVKDIQDACDLLKPVFNSSSGVDGYVSLEVSPHLARDTEGTIKEARHLFKKVKRPNLMIKIPGTAEGIPATEACLLDGINVNVTLLFSVERYEEVARAYVRALERRAKLGLQIKNIASVASFFLSRIDVLIDNRLKEKGATSLLGQAAVANAKLAYQSYKKIFGSDSWQTLAQQGARVQRLLWASTSTKNPDYSDVMYVEPLIGRDTVNTMPEETIAAFADHGKLEPDAIEKGVDEARKFMADLEQSGIQFRGAAQQLEEEGIQKFIDPFDQLMKSLNEKRGRLLKPQMA
jgi:transaldolase